MPFFSYIDAAGDVTLLCWAFAAESVEFGADAVIGFNDHAGAMAALRALVAERLAAGQTLGVESTCPFSVLQLLDEARGTGEPVTVVDDVINRLRLIKSPAEIALLERSIQIVEQSVEELYDTLHLGMSRMDLTRIAKERMARNGAGGMSHVTFSFASANPEFAIHEPLEVGSLVTLDLGGVYEGYCSDNRRYAYGGPVPASLQERYEAMVGIVDAVGAALVPGASYASLYQLALDRFADHGIELLKRFTHTGHNIGIETEEQWLDDSAGPRRRGRDGDLHRALLDRRDRPADRQRGDVRDRGHGPAAHLGAPARDPGGRLTCSATPARHRQGDIG